VTLTFCLEAHNHHISYKAHNHHISYIQCSSNRKRKVHVLSRIIATRN